MKAGTRTIINKTIGTCIIREFQNDSNQSSNIEETSEGEQGVKPTLVLKKSINKLSTSALISIRMQGPRRFGDNTQLLSPFFVHSIKGQSQRKGQVKLGFVASAAFQSVKKAIRGVVSKPTRSEYKNYKFSQFFN